MWIGGCVWRRTMRMRAPAGAAYGMWVAERRRLGPYIRCSFRAAPPLSLTRRHTRPSVRTHVVMCGWLQRIKNGPSKAYPEGMHATEGTCMAPTCVPPYPCRSEHATRCDSTHRARVEWHRATLYTASHTHGSLNNGARTNGWTVRRTGRSSTRSHSRKMHTRDARRESMNS